MFIGRKTELAELESRFQSGNFEMGVVYGARRIGKTSLLQEFSKDKPTLYFQARGTRNTKKLRCFGPSFFDVTL